MTDRIIIARAPTAGSNTASQRDWARERAEFSWPQLRRELFGSATGAGNIASLAVDRHATGSNAGKPALRCLSLDGPTRELSYAELAQRANRFANVLGALGVEAGERVFLLIGRRAELYEAALGTLKAQCVLSILFTAFGPEPLKTRLSIGAARVLVTTASLYRRKIAPLRQQLPMLRHVLLIDAVDDAEPAASARSYTSMMAAAAATYTVRPTAAETPALLHFTSGTTGTPKGAVHVHDAAVMHFMTGRYALDLRPDDSFWCTADPGWVTGTSYGIITPLLHGVTVVVDEGEFDAERWYRILDEQRVSVWYTAPTAIRLLMKAGTELARRYQRPALRLVASVGEPLNAEAVCWVVDALGLPIHDNWWQTETGGIMVANSPALDIKPGSMGKLLPGIDGRVVQRGADGQLHTVTDPNTTGELALVKGWPSMFRGYLNLPDRYAKCFDGELYLSGDLVRQDADGYFWFMGRSDDVIKTSGHLVGPFEVERVLMEHSDVVEAAVIGKPDAVAGEIIMAFVALRPAVTASPELRDKLIAHARRRLGPALAPRELAFAASLPHTRSGKIMRRLLRARELGLPEGDTSALEQPA